MERHHQAMKRRVSPSHPASPASSPRKRRGDSWLNLSLEDSELDRDSGLDTFNSDGSPYMQLDSPGLPAFLRATEELDRDSPILKDLEKMSVHSRQEKEKKTSNKPSTSSSSPSKAAGRALQPTSSNNKKKEKDTYVVGQSIIKVLDDDYHCEEKAIAHNAEFKIRRCYAADPNEQEHHHPERVFEDKENWPGYQKSHSYFDHHPELEADMRSILLEWLMEVCKAHYLQRKTYHMTLDYIDRFLTLTENLPKTLLQLLGIAALSIAAKIEEIFPPKLSELAYVTDDAHSQEEIKSMEKLIFAVLGTAFMPVTPGECVASYLHDAGITGTEARSTKRTENTKISQENQLPLELYSKICRLVDLAMLDADSLNFTYRQIAGAAIYLTEGGREIINVLIDGSGFQINSIISCLRWMRPFADAEERLGPVRLSCPAKMHQVMWPHLQSHDFELETYMEIIEQKRNHPEEDHNITEEYILVDLAEVTMYGEDMPPPDEASTTTPQRTPQSHISTSSLFFTPPDSQQRSIQAGQYDKHKSYSTS